MILRCKSCHLQVVFLSADTAKRGQNENHRAFSTPRSQCRIQVANKAQFSHHLGTAAECLAGVPPARCPPPSCPIFESQDG